MPARYAEPLLAGRGAVARYHERHSRKHTAQASGELDQIDAQHLGSVCPAGDSVQKRGHKAERRFRSA